MKNYKHYYKIAQLIAREFDEPNNEEDKTYLNNWLNASLENKNIYDEIKQSNWYQSSLEDVNEFKIEEGWNKINSRILPSPKSRKLRTAVFKYVAAASVLLIVALTVFLNKHDENDSQFIDTEIVDTAIKPGTDKATLTLANGEQVPLEKGTLFQTQNVDSDGEKITYTPNNKRTKEFVYNYLTIPRGGQFFITLSDGTKVWLNSESQLKYPVSFIDGVDRKVELVYGEAYFDVSPSIKHRGTKFIVLNESQEVEVLGTEFNIKAYKDEPTISTTLAEGKVSVKSLLNTQIIKPGEQTVLNLDDNTITISEVNVYNEISWKDGVFSFEQKPLDEIMKVLSRWYDVQVVFENDNIKETTFTGVLGKKQKVKNILLTLKTLSTIKDYEINDKTITLK